MHNGEPFCVGAALRFLAWFPANAKLAEAPMAVLLLQNAYLQDRSLLHQWSLSGCCQTMSVLHAYNFLSTCLISGGTMSAKT